MRDLHTSKQRSTIIRTRQKDMASTGRTCLYGNSKGIQVDCALFHSHVLFSGEASPCRYSCLTSMGWIHRCTFEGQQKHTRKQACDNKSIFPTTHGQNACNSSQFCTPAAIPCTAGGTDKQYVGDLITIAYMQPGSTSTTMPGSSSHTSCTDPERGLTPQKSPAPKLKVPCPM